MIGVAPAAGALTSPLILIILVEVSPFEVIVTDLLIKPILFVSYFTLIAEEAPGAIGSRGHSGTVHPQEPLALVINNGSVPVFVNTNSH